MSIPLDRLYHYIESVARDVYGDTVIYHFYPHGSKKIEDLNPSRQYDPVEIYYTIPQIFCYDQEPLDFSMYQNVDIKSLVYTPELIDRLTESNIDLSKYNIRNASGGPYNIYDQCVLLHSELNSVNLSMYEQNGFIGAYYWSHAIIARDWFRYARLLPKSQTSQTKKTFLVYNRAWEGSREYRIKFLDLIIQNNLTEYLKSNFNPTDLITGQHYQNYRFKNPIWKSNLILENYFNPTLMQSSASADFDETDYFETDIEVVLETLFDDSRIHLTEKSLRPMALGHPFILCATSGSLKYLKNYGFKTFHSVFDESYDSIVDPLQRLEAIVKLMKSISNWGESEKTYKLNQLREITNFNREYFFSEKFNNLILTELNTNLKIALDKVKSNNTSKRWIDLYNLMCQNKNFQVDLNKKWHDGRVSKQTYDYMYNAALKYYNK